MAACTRSHDSPTEFMRAASCRGPNPTSNSTPKPSVSTTLALPPLPLARTVNRKAIFCTPRPRLISKKKCYNNYDVETKPGGREMTDLSRCNPIARFTGLACIYAQHRPSYPEDAIERVVAFGGLSARTPLVDVGSGTGI